MSAGRIVKGSRDMAAAVRQSMDWQPLPGAHTTWAATVYTGDKAPELCITCGKKGDKLKSFTSGHAECSHIDCPIRRCPTATAGHHFDPETLS